MNWKLIKRDYENYENIRKKINLKHSTGKWKFEASMKNVKKFEISGKSLESLETGDCVLWKGPGVVFLGEK
jgi:hypothetical protein